MSYLEMTKF